MRLWRLPVVSLALAVTHSLAAQIPAARIPIPYRTYFAFNPLLIPFNVGSAEVETGIAPGITVGAVGSYTDVSDDRYLSFDAKLRYYPAEIVLQGFSVGLTGGYLRYSTPGTDTASSARRSLEAATVGVVVDYNWLIGRSRRFVVGTGVGAKRVLASDEDRGRVDLGLAYLTARFVIGYAF